MTKGDVVNLIRCHAEGDEEGFARQAELISQEFYDSGDIDLARYVRQLLSSTSFLLPQESATKTIGPLERIVSTNPDPLYFPPILKDDLIGCVNAVKRKLGINTLLFYGKPGTGKTEAAIQIARLLKRSLWKVNISSLIDSYLGETSKNIASLFSAIEGMTFKNSAVILFDEIDALAYKRNDPRDVREMSRATTELFKGLDTVAKDVVIIATTNLFDEMDPALLRRFRVKISFDVYSHDDLVDIGVRFFERYAQKATDIEPNSRLVRKILDVCTTLPSPGELKNAISTAIAFSKINKPDDYVARLSRELLTGVNLYDLESLKSVYGFSVRDISSITGISKSEVARRIKDE